MANEKSHFDKCIERSEHFLTLYGFVANTRKRSIRSDWADRFRRFMRWPSNTDILRIDGADGILIIKNPPAGLTAEKFEHEYASELLRSAVVSAISAMDKFLHDRTLNVCFRLLRTTDSGLPKRLRKLELPANLGFMVQRRLKNNPTSRPGSDLKKELQKKLHLSTFQNRQGVKEAAELMGISNFWGEVARRMEGNWSSVDVQEKLDCFVMRRNQIVHESDLARKISSNRFPLRDIDAHYARELIDFVKNFVTAVDDEITAQRP